MNNRNHRFNKEGFNILAKTLNLFKLEKLLLREENIIALYLKQEQNCSDLLQKFNSLIDWQNLIRNIKPLLPGSINQ